MSGDEAGREGFWRHRSLVAQGLTNQVIASASIAVNRRQRRAKTERLAGRQRLTLRLRHSAGEQQGWRVVRVPSVDEEDRRQRHRARQTAPQDRPRVINRIQGWFAGHGVPLALQGDGDAQRDQGQPWDGAPRPSALWTRLQRAGQQGGWLPAHLQTLAAERRAL